MVWTWVPFQDDHRQGKDRPVLLIGRDGRWLLAVMLTTKLRAGQDGRRRTTSSRVSIGVGAWDRQRRPSEVRVDRIIRVKPSRIRREGAAIDATRFAAVANGVRAEKRAACATAPEPGRSTARGALSDRPLRIEHMFESTVVAAPLHEELARLRADGRDLSVAELVELVARCQSVTNTAGAVQTLAMAHLAAIEDVELEDGTVVEQHRGLGHQRLDAPALVSEQLGVSDAAASNRMTVAVEVVTRTPGVFDAMASGRLDSYRAGIVCEELREAPPSVCREVVTRIEDSLGAEPAAALRRRVRRALGAVDAELVRARAARARSARSLRRWPGDEPGVDTWMGSFPVEQARSGWAVVDQLARQYVQEGRATGVEEARADALMDLIHSRATGTFVVQLAVPAAELTASAERESAAVSVTHLRLTTTKRLW